MSYPSSMSEQQSVSNNKNRKRRNTYDTSEDSPPVKRIKSTAAARIASNYPPEFWDNLSKVWLTPRALREKDRRNGLSPPATTSAAVSATPTSLARFARRGGPDLRHLRGYPEPKHAARMSSNRSSTPSSRRAQSTKATSVSSKAKRSSAYDRDFEQKLVDYNIYPKGHEYPDDAIPEPGNLDDITQTLSAPRGSLSPSRFDRAAFKAFTLANDRVISEGNVMAKILPTILGDADFPSEGNLPFTNLDSITDGTTVDAVPDLYDGVYPKDVNKTVRQDLNKVIIPTTHGRAPVVPNFFLEAKAPRGGADVAKRQACLDGAIGARAMLSLQNYGKDESVYDDNAHTFSSTYHAGTGALQIYAHHVTDPASEGERPGYHMTKVRGFDLTDSHESFVAGASAIRNAREMARRQRDSFTLAANSKASQLGPPAAEELPSDLHGDHHLHERTNRTGKAPWQESHDDLQRHIGLSFVEGDEDKSDRPTTPLHHYASDGSQDPSKVSAASGTDELSTSFVSSSTSSFSTDTTRPKRSRQSFSSPKQESRSSKSRSRFAAIRHPVVSDAAIAKSGPSDLDESY